METGRTQYLSGPWPRMESSSRGLRGRVRSHSLTNLPMILELAIYENSQHSRALTQGPNPFLELDLAVSLISFQPTEHVQKVLRKECPRGLWDKKNKNTLLDMGLAARHFASTAPPSLSFSFHLLVCATAKRKLFAHRGPSLCSIHKSTKRTDTPGRSSHCPEGIRMTRCACKRQPGQN